MYLKDGYFPPEGPHPADDIGQGYLTVTVPAEELEITSAELEAFGDDPEFIEQLRYKPDQTLMLAVEAEGDADTFALSHNAEVAFDGGTDCGCFGYGLDIAFSELKGLALVTYIGPGLPSIVRRYACRSADEAVMLWDEEWAEELVFTSDIDGDDADDTEQSIH